MCVGKALTGGYLTMAAALCTTRVAEGISRGEVPVLAHGPTFMGNPLAASVALASIGLLLDADARGGVPWQADVARIESKLSEGLAPAREVPGVKDVRVLGAIGVVQLEHPVDVPAATAAAVRRGVWIRPFRDLIYTMPPYITADADLSTLCRALIDAAAASHSRAAP
jgi:adenosylmethionine-8-amino-7-oxononanoate aminotransferase